MFQSKKKKYCIVILLYNSLWEWKHSAKLLRVMFHCLPKPFNKPSSALHIIKLQAINKATAARSALEKIISSYANIIYCLNFLSILIDLPFNLNFVRARFEFDIWRLNVSVLSQILEFFIITFPVVLCTKANKCATKWQRARWESLLLF